MAAANLNQRVASWRTKLQAQSIAVIYGGTSAERNISLKSGQAVVNAMLCEGLDAVGYDVSCLDDVVKAAKQHSLVFLALHGRWGEDGQVQAILQSLGVPFTGSHMAASALAMDKVRTKYVWQGAGLPTPQFYRICAADLAQIDWSAMPIPAMVKASHEGSSIGLFKVDSMQQLQSAVTEALSFDTEVLVEQWVSGREFTFSILGDQVLPAIELKTQHDFYDFEAKYVTGDTQYICPVNLSTELNARLAHLVWQAFEILGAKGVGRIDLMLDESGQPWLIELNTLPGMTDMSLVPKAAKQYGLSYGELCIAIAGLALDDSALA
ncbi:D-alanine--D-alanine ligase [Thiomicrospira sp. ALE5]|uniref:D-alanine--D-alanine ligase n=1 Tax=Thiomicrospira sp. ALE5 TaxID=748650 RepID=UPI000B81307F|nr:D-alanine--D-alanine ligase [Thiomicrospira sp. ALE5]